MKTVKTMNGRNVTNSMTRSIRTLGAAILCAAVLAACSSNDNIIEEQPATASSEPKTYTMTVQATKTAGDAAQTRGLSLDGKTLNVTWFEGEEVEVTQESKAAPINPTSIGTLKAKASSTGTTTLTGTLTGLEEGKVLRFWLHNRVFNYEGQTGVLLKSQGENSIEEKYDFAMMNYVVEDYTVSGSTVSVASPLFFESMQAIVKFTLMDESGNVLNAKSLKIECKNYLFEQMDFLNPTTNTHSSKALTITPATPTNVIYAAISHSTTKADDYTLTATTADGEEYIYTKTDVTFTAGKYYEVKVKMRQYVDLGLSVKWATKNVGATSETECGLYFAWGETTGYTADSGHSFDLDNYAWYNATDKYKYTKYKHDDSSWDYTELQSADDAATQNWGGAWRMPTYAEWDELKENCTAEWKENYKESGISGMLFTSKKEGYTDKSIFLPATGHINGTTRTVTYSIWLCYWSSTLDSEAIKYVGYAYILNVIYDKENDTIIWGAKGDNAYRHFGRAVRAVASK